MQGLNMICFQNLFLYPRVGRSLFLRKGLIIEPEWPQKT